MLCSMQKVVNFKTIYLLTPAAMMIGKDSTCSAIDCYNQRLSILCTSATTNPKMGVINNGSSHQKNGNNKPLFWLQYQIHKHTELTTKPTTASLQDIV